TQRKDVEGGNTLSGRRRENIYGRGCRSYAGRKWHHPPIKIARIQHSKDSHQRPRSGYNLRFDDNLSGYRSSLNLIAVAQLPPLKGAAAKKAVFSLAYQ